MSKTSLMTKARHLRHEETKAEKMLWGELRNKKLGIKWRRQHPIDKFILDFYAPEIKLGIEIDGSSHIENQEYDRLRTEHFESKKIKIIRFWNSEVEKNLKSVIEKITTHFPLSISKMERGQG